MGVKSAIDRDAPEGTDSTTDDHDPNPDPFLMKYATDEWRADSETVNQLLTGLVAVTNLL